LKNLDAGDRTRFKSAVEAGLQTGWAYCFPYLLAKAKPGRREILIAEDAGSLCLFQWAAAEGRLDLLFPPGAESGVLAAPGF
jgi:hypothetical protein